MKQANNTSNAMSRAMFSCVKSQAILAKLPGFLLCLTAWLLMAPTAFAQTSVDNVARIANPSGVPCTDAATNPNCERTDNALITVAPPQPLLTLVKTVVLDNGGTATVADFPLTATGPTTITGVSGDPAITNATVTAGAYTLSEVTVAGYTAGDWSCVVNGGAPVPGATITLADGDNATCSITNDDQPATVLLYKRTDGAAGGPFGFTLTNTVQASGTVTTAAANTETQVDGDAATAGDQALAVATTGQAITIEESSLPAGWVLGSATCTVGGAPVGSLSGAVYTIPGSAAAIGAVIECHFVNEQQPRLTLVKTVTNDDGGAATVADFPLTATGPTTITGISGSAAVTAAPVSAGVYTLSEVTAAGYAAGAWSCDAGTLAGNQLTLTNGQSATCTIVNNDQAATLTLVKTVTNDNGGTATVADFPLTATGPTTITGISGTAAVTAAPVSAGVYTLSEVTAAGYAAGAWSCDAGTLVGNQLTLTNGQSATCTIVNNDQAATLTLVKTVTNDNGGTATVADFPLTATGPSTITGISGTAAVTAAPVSAGVYTLSEVTAAGYAAGAWSCDAGTLAGNQLTLINGQNATCTIVNDDQAATLTLVKTVTNDNGGTATVADFPLTATGPTAITGISGTAAVTAAPVSAGVYTLSEVTAAGYTAGAWSCDAGTLAGNQLTLVNGQSATCTIINNDQAATLTLVKTVTNNNGGTAVAGDFTLTADNGAGTVVTGPGNSAAVTGQGVPAGTYTLSETNISGYAAGTWSCDAGTLNGNQLTLTNGQNATCTIVNDDQPAGLTLIKNVINDNGGTAVASDFTLTADNGAGTVVTGPGNSPAVTGQIVPAGTYTLSETNVSGYAAGAWSCDAGTLNGNQLTLTNNQSAICTIVNNDQAATLTLVKTVTNDNGGTATVADFPLTATGPTTITGISGTAAVTAAPISAGVYTLSEVTAAGYAAGAWSCDAGTLVGNQLTLTNGQSATCTIVNNDQAATLTLVKNVVNDNGGTATVADFPLTATGPTTITGISGAAAVTAAPVSAGIYTLSEVTATGYAAGAWSCDAGTLAGDQLTLTNGQNATCTIVNDDIAVSIAVSKTATPGGSVRVSIGDTITYTLRAEVTGAPSRVDEPLVDTLGAGLSMVMPLPNGCAPTSAQGITCTLPAGTPTGVHTFTYQAVVTSAATTQVQNNVVPTNGVCSPGPCSTTHQVNPTVTVNKSVNVGANVPVSVGDTLTYTLAATVANANLTVEEVLTDTLGNGLTAGPMPAGCSVAGQVITCRLPVGTAPSATPYTFTYTATVGANATTQVENRVVPTTGVCETCVIVNPLRATVTVNKSVNVGAGTPVSVGNTLTYTLTATVSNAASTTPEVLTDTLGTGLTVGTLPTGCSAAGQVITCTLASGAAIGTHTFIYTATVNETATTSVSNSVVTTTGVCQTCTVTNPVLPTVTVNKAVNPASGTRVSVGDTLAYTLTATVANANLAANEVLTDTLGAGLVLGTVPAGCAAAGQVITCTVPAGSVPGVYTFDYTATVDASATTAVTNTVVPTNGVCQACVTENPVAPMVRVNKTVDPASGTPVRAGQTLTYTLTAVVTNANLVADEVLTDTLGTGLTVGTVPDGCAVSGQVITCTMPANAAPGTYTFTYTATVAGTAISSVTNSVTASTGVCETCTTQNPLVEPIVRVNKSSNPGVGGEVVVGDTIDYTLTATIENSAVPTDVRLVDTPGAGLTIGVLPTGCTSASGQIVCVLPAGTAPGTYTFAYPAVVNASATDGVSNTVAAAVSPNGPAVQVTCTACATQHRVVEQASLRVVKTAGVREAQVGDLVRYRLTVENVGTTNARAAVVVDTPPAGFTYVEGSLSVVDDDNAATVSGQSPIRFEGLDVAAGQSATLVYMMRVGAGVRKGTQVNQAQAFSSTGTPISNIGTAELTLVSDPLVDDSLIFGTVFNDRDGDSWQDSAALTGVSVQGGFAPDAYVPGSTLMDRGLGAQPLPDASAPLLHGVRIGDIAARQSEADTAQAHQVVIRQHLSKPSFTGDFVLTSDQGVTVRMDADGRTTVERSGEAAKGLNAAAPTVERRVAQGEGGYVVDYVIGNDGIDERGIPGVRIASVEGLLIETDPFGRYHLVGIPGGQSRGRNFILKVDPATLPVGTEMTTDNPLVRRITPGVPVRFDFGAKMPVEEIAGGAQQVELELGEVIFTPGSAEVREAYLPVIDRIAAKLDEYQGGEVVISVDGEGDAMAFDRAAAVKTALMQRLPTALVPMVSVSVRTAADDPATHVTGVDGQGPVLGTVLFDTNRADIKPEFAPLIERVAAYLEQAGGGTVSIVGHTDLRASDDYNMALGMRRARAVYEALAAHLSPTLRSRVRVDTGRSPAAPAGVDRK